MVEAQPQVVVDGPRPLRPWAYNIDGFAPDDDPEHMDTYTDPTRNYIRDADDAKQLLAKYEPNATTPLVFAASPDALCEIAEVINAVPHGPLSVDLLDLPSRADPSCLAKLAPTYLNYGARPRDNLAIEQHAFFELARAVPELGGLGYSGFGGAVHDDPTLDREDLDALESMAALHAVALHNIVLDRDVAASLASLPHLRSLDIEGKSVTLEFIGVIAKTTDLWRFACKRCTLGDAGMAEIAKFKQLRVLLLDSAGIHDHGMQHLAGLRELEVLDLTRNTSVSNDGIAHLRGLVHMQRLWLSTLAIDSQALPHLAGMTKLEILHLDRTAIDDEHLEVLLEMPELRELDLWSTKVGDAGAANIGQLKQLEILSLEGTEVTSEALKSIANLRALRQLQLRSTAVHDGLNRLGWLEQLEYLGLSGTRIDDEDLKVALPPNLRTLDVSYTRVSDELAEQMQSDSLDVLVESECSG